MESWSYVSDKKGFVTNELVSPADSISRSKNAFLDLEFKTPYSYGNNVVVQNEQTIENQGFGDIGFFEMIRQPLPENSIRNDVWSSKDSGGRIINPIVGIQNAFSGYGSNSKLSSSVVESNSQDSLLIDLNLGRFVDNQDSQKYHQPSKVASVLSSAESSTPAKRVRVGGLNSQAPLCQVYGCNKDLRSSKDYHKRHKVCEVHSKTSKVIVNGIEQRFCQQCSRFHLIAEFDDGKRSCRKRLAGHNERRRKPQLGRAGSLLPTFKGSRSEGTTLTRTSFICQDILPGGSLSHSEKYGTNDWCRRIKDEYETDYTPLSAIPTTSGPMHSKSILPPCFEKHFPTFHDNETINAPGSIFSENSSRYPHFLGGPNSRSRSFVQDSSLGSEDFTVFNTASTVQRLSNISDSGCALSLLSSQSQNSSYYSSGISMAHHLVMPGSNTHYSVSQISEKFMGVGSQAFTSGLSNKFLSSGMTSVDGDHLGPVLISEDSDAVNFRIADGIFPGSDLVNAEDRLSCEDEPTIDLLQLSSQLQRVEHERQSMQAKKENNAFCCHQIT